MAYDKICKLFTLSDRYKMKNIGVSMFKVLTSIGVISIGLTGCISHDYAKPLNLRFQDKTQLNSQIVEVKRNHLLCANDTVKQQDCPIEFYIDSFKSGQFYINNSAKYFLKTETYNFKVKNCNTNECQSCDVDIQPDQLKDKTFILSVDGNGQPFISNAGKPLACNEEQKKNDMPIPVVAPAEETTTQINLAADTLFKFDRHSLNDLLPKGRQEVIDLAYKITSGYASVRAINLVGHTDRLGNENYNKQLGLNRAKTVKALLVQNGVNPAQITVSSQGENQPVTNGCFDLKHGDELKACLQPDRRVSVEITGISR